MRKPTHQAHREACDTQSALWRKVSPTHPSSHKLHCLGHERQKSALGFLSPPIHGGGRVEQPPVGDTGRGERQRWLVPDAPPHWQGEAGPLRNEPLNQSKAGLLLRFLTVPTFSPSGSRHTTVAAPAATPAGAMIPATTPLREDPAGVSSLACLKQPDTRRWTGESRHSSSSDRTAGQGPQTLPGPGSGPRTQEGAACDSFQNAEETTPQRGSAPTAVTPGRAESPILWIL